MQFFLFERTSLILLWGGRRGRKEQIVIMLIHILNSSLPAVKICSRESAFQLHVSPRVNNGMTIVVSKQISPCFNDFTHVIGLFYTRARRPSKIEQVRTFVTTKQMQKHLLLNVRAKDKNKAMLCQGTLGLYSRRSHCQCQRPRRYPRR